VTKINWEKAALRDKTGPPRKARSTQSKKERGITNGQARELAKLQRRLKLRYTGNGMTAKNAADLIAQLESRLDSV
jgi:hypothetical protein